MKKAMLKIIGKIIYHRLSMQTLIIPADDIHKRLRSLQASSSVSCQKSFAAQCNTINLVEQE